MWQVMRTTNQGQPCAAPALFFPQVKASVMSDLVPVSPDRHGAQVWQRFRSYDFVQDHPLVPIVLGEQEQVAATLPIVAQRHSGALWPMAVTRLGPRSAMVAANGVWRGSYVPSILRVHPFAARLTTDSPAQCVLLVNEATGLVSPRPGVLSDGQEPFFTEDGQLSPVLAQIVAFFQARIPAEEQTRAAMAALDGAKLLTPTPPLAGVSVPDGALWLDPVALAALGRSELAHLHRLGALGLAHAMLVARHHLGFLAQVEAQLDQIAAPVAPALVPRQTRPEDAALAGFFDAIAASQTRD